MKLPRSWLVAAALALLVGLAIGMAAVRAEPLPSPSATEKNYAQVFVDKLAAILHRSSSQTQDDLKQAALQTVDQMLSDGRITKEQADALKQRIESGQGLSVPFGPRFDHFSGSGDPTLMRDLKTAEQDAVAKALGLTTADLQSQLRAGKSIAELEQAKGVSDATVRAAVKDAAKGVLDKAVQAGRITQAQEDQTLERIGSGRGPRFERRPGFGF